MNEHQLSQLERLAKLKEQGVLTDEELAQQKAQIMAGDSPIQIEKAAPAETVVRSVPKKKKPSAGKVAAILVGAIVVLSVIGKISNDSTPRPPATETADTSSYMSTDTATSTEYTPPAPENWSYYDDTDKMGSRIVTASTDSKNQLQFDFPYSGGSTATLTLRHKKGDTDAYVRISKGQLLIDDYEGSHCRVRFDEGKPVTYAITGPSDHSSDIFFIDSVGGFIKRLKKAKTVVIEAEFYQAGFQQMEFDVSDLKWKY